MIFTTLVVRHLYVNYTFTFSQLGALRMENCLLNVKGLHVARNLFNNFLLFQDVLRRMRVP